MKRILLFLQLIRFPNIIFLLLLVSFMHFFVFLPIVRSYGIVCPMHGMALCLILLTVASTAAAGYIINDYFDIKIDRINRPDRVIIGETISKQTAMQLFYCFSAIGLVCGAILAWWTRTFNVIILVLLVTGLLWFYSATYKRQFLIGNVIVAAICASVPFFMGMVDMGLVNIQYAQWVTYTPLSSDLFKTLSGIAGFIFLATLIREILKDFQDEEGDREMECHTLPIVLGAKKAKTIVISLIAINIICVSCIFLFVPFSLRYAYCRYILLFVVVPQIYLLWLTANAEISSDYRKTQLLMKAVMFLSTIGLLFLPKML